MPLVGIAVVAAGILAARTYIGTERKTQDVLAFDIMLERLSQDLQLSMALMEIHRGKAEEAAQRLDLLLCRNILRTDSELAFTDGRARPIVEEVFRELALIRPSIAQRGAAGSAAACDTEQMVAERILNQALTGTRTGAVRQRDSGLDGF